MDKKVVWGQKVGSQGLPNPGTVLSFQPTATNSDQILEFVTFLHSGKKVGPQVLPNPGPVFKFPTNSNQQRSNFRVCYFFVLWQVTYA